MEKLIKVGLIDLVIGSILTTKELCKLDGSMLMETGTISTVLAKWHTIQQLMDIL